jgi:hypothetical protein
MKLSPSVRGALRFDGESSTYNYVGDAPEGSSESAAVWRIYRITNSGTASLAKEWADGNSNFDNVWANRASLSYS